MSKFFSPIFRFLSIIISIYIIIYIISKFECLTYVISNYDIINTKNDKSIKLVFLSDFHNKKYPGNNQLLIEDIIKINPDYIILGGDFIDFSSIQSKLNNSKYKNTISFINNLSKRINENKANPDFKFKRMIFGFGNHELRLKERTDNEFLVSIYNEFIDCLTKNDVLILYDDIYDLDDNFSISGLNLYHGYYRNIFSERPNIKHIELDILDKYFKDIDMKKFNIMAFHKPDYCEDFLNYGYDLVLSGHNHGGLIKFPFIGPIFSPDLELLPKYNHGLYTINDKYAIVSSGIGEHFVKLRVNNRPEICVINIHGKDNI